MMSGRGKKILDPAAYHRITRDWTCPYCSEMLDDDGDISVDDFETVVIDLVCPHCLKRWQEIFRLEAAILLDEEEKEDGDGC